MGSEEGNIQNTKALYQGLQVEPSDTLRITRDLNLLFDTSADD